MNIRQSLFANRLSILIFFLLLLTTFYFLLTPNNVFALSGQDYIQFCQEIAADPAPPGPTTQGLQEPKWDELDSGGDKTTVYDNFQIIDVPTKAGQIGGNLSVSNPILPNAKEIADYLEGPFLDEGHRLADFRKLSASQLLSYNGPVVELTPQIVQDRLRRGYVFALVELGKGPFFGSPYKIPDINLLYSDVCGANPRTIFDLVQTWGMPDPPSLKFAGLSPTQEEFQNYFRNWLHTWGKYWPKIPVHDPFGAVACDLGDAACRGRYPEGNNSPPNMRTQGCLVFTRPAFGQQPTPEGSDCPQFSNPPSLQVVKLGIPDLARLDTLARFVQQLVSPQQIIRAYFCRFRNLPQFCDPPHTASKLGQTTPPQGETGSGGNPIYIYDEKTNQKTDTASVDLVGPADASNVGIESKFPYLGLTFGKLASALTGAFKFFDPSGILNDEASGGLKYQKNSTKIPYSYSFSDETCDYEIDEFGNLIPGPSCFGTVTEPKVWAGFLSGVKNAKDFVINSLNPFKAL